MVWLEGSQRDHYVIIIIITIDSLRERGKKGIEEKQRV